MKIETSVDLHDVEVEVEITDDIIQQYLDESDDPLKFMPPNIRVEAEAVYQHIRCNQVGPPPECLRTLLYSLIGRTM
jgi:hypothetical protein